MSESRTTPSSAASLGMTSIERKRAAVVYTPDSKLRSPRRLGREMIESLLASRELGWILFVRNFRGQFRESALGFLWAFLPAFATGLTFVYLHSEGLLVAQTEVPYAVFAICSTLLWQVLVDSIGAPLKLVSSSRSMLTKINFPKESLLLAAAAEVVLNCMIRMLLLAGILFFFRHRIDLPATVWLVPLGLACILVFGLAIGVLLVPIGALYTDVMRAIPIATTFWMLLTPVVYPPKIDGLAGAIASWNPATPLIVATRDWLLTGETGSVEALCWVGGASSIALLIGWAIFHLSIPFLVERMGN